ncbi:hypothetical protein QAD02_010097 [Eretmocerus hayati]|uniref:Uncharacterized protein n=1 Tax=Eretmocerus hayati TaxID=131215 RepID=A0ACC2NDL4_9HYME|nr:hypothetical protein QAD02_010097 [Eretmocerus hayati]
METSSTVSEQYWQCGYCVYLLPKENYDFTNHACFANFDPNTQDLYCEGNRLVIGGKAGVIDINNPQEPNGQEAYEEDEAMCGLDDECEENNNNANSQASTTKKTKSAERCAKWNGCNEILIEAVRVRPYLWNFHLPLKERLKDTVEDGWKEVQIALEAKKWFTIAQIIKRFSDLRDAYKKEKRKRDEECDPRNISSGSGRKAKNRKGFALFEHLTFLNAVQIHRKCSSNIPVPKPTQTSEVPNSDAQVPHLDAEVPDSCGNSVEASVPTQESRGGLIDEQAFDDATDFHCPGPNSATSPNSSLDAPKQFTYNKRKKSDSSDTSFRVELLKSLSQPLKNDNPVKGYLILIEAIMNKMPEDAQMDLGMRLVQIAREAQKAEAPVANSSNNPSHA